MPQVLNAADALLVGQLEDAAQQYVARHQGSDLSKAQICRDIASRTRRYGAFASERQRSYAEALVRWSQPNQTPAQRAVGEVQHANAMINSQRREVAMGEVAMSEALMRIVQLMTAAVRNGLSFPKIRLQRGEWKIRIYPAPRHGSHPGDFYVKANRLYCGRITTTGNFLASRECPLDVILALREFNANPERVATAYGHATSNCCFCGRGLTDARSVAMGYGPICADHFGLEWGDQRAAQSVTVPSFPPTIEQLRSMAARDVADGYPSRLSGRNAPSRRQSAFRAAVERERMATAMMEERDRRLMRDFVAPVPSMPRPAPVARPADPEDEDSHFMHPTGEDE